MKKTKIYMGIPSTGTRVDAQTYFLREVESRYKDHIELIYPKQCIYRTFHDFARNGMTEEFLESDCDMIWFLDSDVVPPHYVLDLVALHGDKWEAAGAVYPIFMKPPGGEEACVLFTAYKGVVNNETTKGITMAEVPKEGTDWLDGLATGCMFLRRSVFAKLQKPYFEFKFDPESRQMREGEDLGFCLKLAALGIKFFTDYSMVCKHYKTVCLLDINNYATSMSNCRVLDYDKEIRGKVQDALSQATAAAYELGKRDALKTQQRTSKTGLILPNSLAT